MILEVIGKWLMALQSEKIINVVFAVMHSLIITAVMI